MNSADLIIANARVLTVNAAAPRAEAVAMKGNRILRVGSNADVASLKAKHTRVIDAQGHSVIPGFVESHVHLFMGAVELSSLHVNNIKGFAALSESVREFAKSRPDDAIIIANGGNYTMIRDDGVITRHDLDTILSDRPFILICFDHHTVWANTRALAKAGILHGRALPTGNEIVMGRDGLATGELKEFAAFDPVLALTPTGGRDWLGLTTGHDPMPAATSAQRATDQRFLKQGLAYCASLGITSIHNMDGNWYQLELLDALREAGDLLCRAEVPFHFKNYYETPAVDEAIAMREKYQGDLLHSGRVKIFMDGVIESMTALTLDDYPGHPGNTGAPNFTPEQFNAVATRADAHKLQISVHAIGDGAVRRTLDGYAAARRANGARDSRHRIEHIEMIDPADIPRLKELGVVASMQPIVGLGVPGALLEPCFSRIGPKLKWSYGWQTLRDTGAAIAFSSDWPISPLDPILGMQSAMTQVPLTPECPPQAQSLSDALHGFTLGGAYCEFREDRKGMLKEGYYADVVVLDGDLESAPAAELATIKPRTTICDGRVTFER